MSQETPTPESTRRVDGMPTFGLGTWQNESPEQCAESVRTALEMGYRHVDTATAYDNEEQVGLGIEAAAVDREDVFVTTKVWRSDLRDGDLQASVETSLDELGMDSVDLLLAHWTHPRIEMAETLDAMEAVQERGLVEHIGVANYTAGQLEEAVAFADAPIVTNQVQYHPFKDQSNVAAVCREHDVALTAYSPLARGGVLGHKVLGAIGEKYDKSAAQVALRWLVQQENVLAIPKATSDEHLAANLDIFDFSLSDAEMNSIYDCEPGLKQRLQNKLPAMMRNVPL
jgi:diketogulonate reductase-like aldo/keto reductase